MPLRLECCNESACTAPSAFARRKATQCQWQHNERKLDGCRLRRHQQEEEQLAPAEDEEEEEEEESEYETDSEEEGFGRALLKPVFVPKVCTCEPSLQLLRAGHEATVSRLLQVPLA